MDRTPAEKKAVSLFGRCFGSEGIQGLGGCRGADMAAMLVVTGVFSYVLTGKVACQWVLILGTAYMGGALLAPGTRPVCVLSVFRLRSDGTGFGAVSNR